MTETRQTDIVDAREDPSTGVMALELSPAPYGPVYQPEVANSTHMVGDPFLKDPYEKDLVEVRGPFICRLAWFN